MTTANLAQQMESFGFGNSLEERNFFMRPPTSGRLVRAMSAHSHGAPRTTQMESLGFGDSIEERIFFMGPTSSREPTRVARLQARKAAAELLRASVVGPQDKAHRERLAVWSRRLAQELGLSAERALDVELGALLHDVGCTLLEEMPVLRRAIPLAAAHRERFDGEGYPRGQRANDIPLEARIFHLVDAYEAMTREHPHHVRMSDAEAREELECRAGSHLDPVVHAAFDCIDPSEWLDITRHVR
jgi:response regulator RpfG family c-di-GMP phosphodiesterase